MYEVSVDVNEGIAFAFIDEVVVKDLVVESARTRGSSRHDGGYEVVTNAAILACGEID